MPTRSSAVQVAQIGKETVPGTPVAANRRLGSIKLTPKAEAETSDFRPSGNKYVTVVAENKAWTSFEAEGQPTYEEIIYPLASVFTAPVSAQVMAGATATGAYTHTFTPKSEGLDSPVTYTVETGDATYGFQAALGLFTDFGLEVSREEVSMDGEMIAMRMKSKALTASPTQTSLTPILPGQVCVYLADNPTDLGQTTGTGVRLTNVISVNPSVGSRFSPTWFLNCQVDSFTSFVENAEPDFEVEFMAEADAEGLKWLDRLKTGKTAFLRVEATGPVIASKTEFPTLQADVNAKMTWDFAVKVSDPGDFSDEDGVYAIGPTLTVVHDPAWGKASQVVVTNKVATA